jgi:hypothetical protein
MSIQINVLSSLSCINRINAIKNTWGKYYDTIFYADFNSRDIIKCTNDPSKQGNEEKKVNRLKQLKQNNIYDWYLFVDDDTFVNTKNLKPFINQLDKNYFYGVRWTDKRNYPSLIYPQGGCGYFISKENIDNIKPESLYIRGSSYSDVTMGQILKQNNISCKFLDFKDGILNFKKPDSELAQQNAITMHYISAEEMYELHDKFLID